MIICSKIKLNLFTLIKFYLIRSVLQNTICYCHKNLLSILFLYVFEISICVCVCVCVGVLSCEIVQILKGTKKKKNNTE